VADTFTPDIGQRIDPAGRVTYDFDGHIHARGVDLDAGAFFATNDDKVRWLAADGTEVAEIHGYQTGPDSNGVAATASHGLAFATVLARAANASAADTNIAVITPGHAETLLDGAGRSSYVRLGVDGLLRLYGPYTIDSGPLNPGDLSVANLFHNLGQPVYPAGELRDLGFACDIGRAFARTSANQLDIAFRNLGPTSGARAELNLFLLTTT
jgi:hypothetical protein